MITDICKIACAEHGISKITTRVEKPSALTFAKGAAVEITRRRDYFSGSRTPLGLV